MLLLDCHSMPELRAFYPFNFQGRLSTGFGVAQRIIFIDGIISLNRCSITRTLPKAATCGLSIATSQTTYITLKSHEDLMHITKDFNKYFRGENLLTRAISELLCAAHRKTYP